MIYDLETLLLSNFKGRVREGQIQIKNCPFCNNKRWNMEVSLEKEIYHCWVCDTSGTAKYLLKTFDIAFEFDEYDRPLNINKIKKEVTEVELPESFTSIETKSYIGKIAYNYLISRGITQESVDKFKIGYCYKGKYSNRIILSVYEEQILKYFIGRDFSSNSGLRYLNPVIPKEDILFNWDMNFKKIVLCEGILDAISICQAGFNGVGLLGKQIYHSQIFKLLRAPSQLKEVIILLDRGFTKESKKIAWELSYPNITIKIGYLKDEDDPNSTEKKDLTDIINNAIIYSRF